MQSTASITPVPTPPVNIPGRGGERSQEASVLSASPPNHAITSSDEEGPGHPSPSMAAAFSPAKGSGAPIASDPTKVILSGYLMKCGKRKTWRKRWFVLNGEKLMYCGNHMVGYYFSTCYSRLLIGCPGYETPAPDPSLTNP